MKKASLFIIVFALLLVQRLLTASELDTTSTFDTVSEVRVVSEDETASEPVASSIKGPANAAIQAGDLVFFQVSEKGRHVGIYLKDDVFLHSSTKDGVTLNRMSDTYWNERLITVRRVEHDISLDEFMNAYKRYDHARYGYGRTGPDRFDCSGFVWRVFSNHEVALPRATKEQLHMGTLVVTGEEYLAMNTE